MNTFWSFWSSVVQNPATAWDMFQASPGFINDALFESQAQAELAEEKRKADLMLTILLAAAAVSVYLIWGRR